jgi:mRNA export factor
MLSSTGAGNMGSGDVMIQPGPSDTVSDLSLCPIADFLAASSWDQQVRIYQLQTQNLGTSGGNIGIQKASIQHDAPALCCTWSQDGSKVFSGGADKQIRAMDMNTGQVVSFAAHDAPVKSLRWMDHASSPALISGSWDKTLKYWDLRQSQPAAVISLPERCYSMDVAGSLLVAACAERHVVIVNLSQPTTIFKTLPSPLKWQTRSISCMPNGLGYAIGSIEGRVGIQYVEEKKPGDNFAFKCHRSDNNAYAVNCISFHPIHGTLSTAGSDGTFQIWDKDSKQRLKSCPNLGGPVTATAFSKLSDIFIYSIGYDWSKGYENYLPNAKNGIFVHKLNKQDIEPKSSNTNTLSGSGGLFNRRR